jgi:6-phosphogluconolactonase/glucosamine-6-phosphate isomerase/deaminase
VRATFATYKTQKEKKKVYRVYNGVPNRNIATTEKSITHFPHLVTESRGKRKRHIVHGGTIEKESSYFGNNNG